MNGTTHTVPEQPARFLPSAIVFDMDGLILDTERIALEGFLQACRALGIHLDRDTYDRCLGTTTERTRELLLQTHGPDFPLDAVFEHWDHYCNEYMIRRPPPIKPGLAPLMETIRRRAIPYALATSASGAEASGRLRSAGLDAAFPLRVTGDQVSKGKPDPEIYRKATALLGVHPRRSLALEDSANGVLAAHRAGLQVIQIPDLSVSPDPAALALGHRVMRSLCEVAELLGRSPGR